MRQADDVIDGQRARLRRRWQWRRFWRVTGLLGCAACGLFLLLGVAMLSGLIHDHAAAAWYREQILRWSALAWMVLIAFLRLRPPSVAWLDARLEEAEPRLLDRLHSLRFLDSAGGPAQARPLRPHIERGAREILAAPRGAIALPTSGAAASLLALVGSLVTTVAFYERLHPWDALPQTPESAPRHAAEEKMPPTPDRGTEAQRAWGEVRITAPGRDLRVTKVDVVPLQIEAAADRALESVAWVHVVNGAAETVHPLPPPPESRFAAYQPAIYLDALGVSDWDVVIYYAKADASGDHTYASQIYFLEVHPFRTEIASLPGGGNGQAGRLLSALTHLIARQEHIIRETYRHAQQQRRPDEQRRQERLAAAEVDLRDAVSHLHARIVEELSGAVMETVLASLGHAEQWLDKAAMSLIAANLGEAQERERRALRELSETRKSLYQATAAHPDRFAEGDRRRSRPEADPLTAIAELRDAAAAARAFSAEARARQESISARARRPQLDAGALAEGQEHLARDLDAHATDHFSVLADLPAADQARRALAAAARSMRADPQMSVVAAEEAERALAALDRALAERLPHRLLSTAYQLRRLLEDEIRALEQIARDPSTSTAEARQQQAERVRRLIRELQEALTSPPTMAAFGPEARAALRDTSALGAAADAFGGSGGADAGKHAAALAAALQSLGAAFDASVPRALKEADASRPFDQDARAAWQRGVEQIESLLRRAEGGPALDAGAVAAQQSEALANLEQGAELLRGESGHNETADAFLVLLGQARGGAGTLQLELLRRLREQVLQLAIEPHNPPSIEAHAPPFTLIDPARLPPAYRQSIETYFKKLSESAAAR